MTSVYLLTDGPDDNERNVIGVFSSLDRMEKIRSLFETYGGYHGTLYSEAFELNDLEVCLPVISKDIAEGVRVYNLSRYVHNPEYPPKWTIHQMAPYEYKYDKDESGAYSFGDHVLQYATIRTTSEEEAIRIADGMLEGKSI